MRLRLWQRLFLAFAALSGLALAGFVGWQQFSFRRGFLDYLNEVSLQRLQKASDRLAARYSEHGNWEFLRGDPRLFDELIDPDRAAFDRTGMRAQRPPLRADGSVDDRPPPGDRESPARGGPPDDRDRGPPPEPPSAPGDRDAREPSPDGGPRDRFGPGPPSSSRVFDLRARVALVDAQGVAVAGARVPMDALSVPVQLDGNTVGSLRLAPLPKLESGPDLAFAAAQRRDALVAALAVLVGAFALAFALARWLLAPVRALTDGTRALAAGDYARRIAATRHDELGALADDFNHLAASLEQHRDARRRWGADIAHELRTPLSVLRGEVQALQDGVRAPTAQAFDSLNAECERLGGLIEDLYQLALADAAALEYRFEAIDLAEIVAEAIDLQRPAANDAGLTLEAAIPASPSVRGDARRLAQLVDNLLANARRHTDAPGRIRVELGAVNGMLQLSIEDTPPGVPAQDLPRLFERLYRAERSRTRASGGAGLGLAICRAIVDAHGGHIDAQPSPLGGLRVVTRLPIATAEDA